MLTDAQIDRYSRHILLDELGGRGQLRLLRASARVTKIDAAGRACLLWLARAGVGRLGWPDDGSLVTGLDPAGLLLLADDGRLLSSAIEQRLAFHHPEWRRSESGVEIDPGATVEAGVRAALSFVRAVAMQSDSPAGSGPRD